MATATLIAAAPYIIEQDYAAYTDEQHSTWSELVERVLPELEQHAARAYIDGFQIIGLQRDRLPNLAAISARLQPRTGWNSTPVSGFLPAPAFFEMLANRLFPTTIWLRRLESLRVCPSSALKGGSGARLACALGATVTMHRTAVQSSAGRRDKGIAY